MDLAGRFGRRATGKHRVLPGGRWGATAYTDAAGNVWMFGGQGYDSGGNVGLLNDLWKYNIAAKT
jgi:hypothetical protein